MPWRASLIISALMSDWAQLSRRPRLPTSMRLASRRASSSTSSETRSSNRMTSADCKARRAFSVSSSASPGPAPTSVTRPRAVAASAPTSAISARASTSAAAPGAGPERALGQPLPERAALCARRQLGIDRRAQALGDRAPRRERRRQQRLDAAADRLRQDRCGAIGRDADHDRRAIDDRAELELAERRPSMTLTSTPARARRIPERLGLRVVLRRAQRQRRIGEDVGGPRAGMMHERAGRRAALRAAAAISSLSARPHRPRRGRRQPQPARPSTPPAPSRRRRRRACPRDRGTRAAWRAAPMRAGATSAGFLDASCMDDPSDFCAARAAVGAGLQARADGIDGARTCPKSRPRRSR